MVKQRMIAGFVAHHKLNVLKYAKHQASRDYEHPFCLLISKIGAWYPKFAVILE